MTLVSGEEARMARELVRQMRFSTNEEFVLSLPSELRSECYLGRDCPGSDSVRSKIWMGIWLGKVPIAMKECKVLRVSERDAERWEVTSPARSHIILETNQLTRSASTLQSICFAS